MCKLYKCIEEINNMTENNEHVKGKKYSYDKKWK